MGIDAFVLRKAPDFFERYEYYRKYYLENEHVLFLSYEDMINDYESWVKSFVLVFEVPGSRKLIKQLCREDRAMRSQVSTVDEDQSRHVRQLVPGDYQRKLRP
jgi:hypothetical protein